MESEGSQQFCLRWHNHQSSVLGGLPALLDSGRLTDVTLCAGGRSLRAHRIVLSTCSPYFMDIFKELPSSQQPVVVVLGGSWAELCCLVAFMYAGEVTLPRALLPGLLRLAATLRITGLTDLNGNIPEVPSQTEVDDSLNPTLETNSSPEEPILNRNNDSASSAETHISPFQKSFESHLAAKNLEPLNISRSFTTEPITEPYQGIFLNTLTLTHHTDKENIVNEELFFDADKIELGTRSVGMQGKRGGRGEGRKYLSPALSELQSKNRKIDKIVETLKCNQRKSREMHSLVSRGKLQSGDLQKSYLNLSSSLEQLERINSAQKLATSDVMPAGSKAADIYAGSNIFMETEADHTGPETPTDNNPINTNTETDSSPEIIPDLKYVSLSPGVQTIGIHSPTNAKLYATCYVCHKQLSNQYNLRVHLETHQNARHACVACSHVSRSRDALRKHVSYRHPQLNTSHSVGRPCKANQNLQNILQSPIHTPPNTTNIFNYPNTATDTGESIDLSAGTLRHSSGPDISFNRLMISGEPANTPQSTGAKSTDKDDTKKSNCGL